MFYNFKKHYRNGQGNMFWNTLMLFMNKLQESKEQYYKDRIRNHLLDFTDYCSYKLKAKVDGEEFVDAYLDGSRAEFEKKAKEVRDMYNWWDTITMKERRALFNKLGIKKQGGYTEINGKEFKGNLVFYCYPERNIK